MLLKHPGKDVRPSKTMEVLSTNRVTNPEFLECYSPQDYANVPLSNFSLEIKNINGLNPSKAGWVEIAGVDEYSGFYWYLKN